MSDQKRNEPAPTLGAVLRELGRQFRTSFWATVAAKQAERGNQWTTSKDGGNPAPSLRPEERAWPGPTGTDRPA